MQLTGQFQGVTHLLPWDRLQVRRDPEQDMQIRKWMDRIVNLLMQMNKCPVVFGTNSNVST